VRSVERSGSQVLVTGYGDFATGVTAELAKARVLVADLRLEQRTLDDAFIALTGRSLHDDADDGELEAVR
jgi:ABC-2 type transport system ATP-binding protein